jgi:hypothetical protein
MPMLKSDDLGGVYDAKKSPCLCSKVSMPMLKSEHADAKKSPCSKVSMPMLKSEHADATMVMMS